MQGLIVQSIANRNGTARIGRLRGSPAPAKRLQSRLCPHEHEADDRARAHDQHRRKQSGSLEGEVEEHDRDRDHSEGGQSACENNRSAHELRLSSGS